MENNRTKIKWINLIFGIFLLVPPVISVIFFVLTLIKKNSYFENFIDTPWTGYEYGESGPAYTSALPLYFGMMAIAGAILVSKSAKD